MKQPKSRDQINLVADAIAAAVGPLDSETAQQQAQKLIEKLPAEDRGQVQQQIDDKTTRDRTTRKR